MVYQLKSVERSPAQYHMSSTISASVCSAEGVLAGKAFNAIAWGHLLRKGISIRSLCSIEDRSSFGPFNLGRKGHDI